MHLCYIIYSRSINRFYIGETEDIERRLTEHNAGTFKGSFTKQANDWELYLLKECKTRIEARKLELFIKKMKSCSFIERLKDSPEILDNILKTKIRGS